MVSSEAPAQTISTMASQNTGTFSRPRIPMPFPSSTSGSMGQVAKLYVLYNGSSAHRQASHFQRSMPNTAKNAVDTTTTPTDPQQ